MDLGRLGEKIRNLRKTAGFSQEDLAERARIANRALQRIETGRANPTLETLDSIAGALGVSVGALFDDGNTPRRSVAEALAKPSQARAALAEAARLLSAMALASAPRRALILALVHRDDSHLDALPREIAQAFRVLLKVP